MCLIMSSRYSSQANRESSLAIISCLLRAIILAVSFAFIIGAARELCSSDSTKKVLSGWLTYEAILIMEDIWKDEVLEICR